MIKTKKCIGPCEQELELNANNFYRHKRYKDGFRNTCRKCFGKPMLKKIIKNSGIIKKCNGICGLSLDLNEANFKKNTKSKDGFRGLCRKCQGKGVPSKIIEENGKQYQICTGKCKLKKELNKNNFRRCKRSKYKFTSICKVCLLSRGKKYRENNKENIDCYQKRWRKNNKDYINEHQKIYRSKPENKQRRNDNERIRLQTDPVYRLKCNTSRTIRKAIKSQYLFNSDKTTLNHLPYTIEELKIHIESLWEPWMNWGNWGLYNKNRKTWQIDHIIAQTKLPFDSLDHPNFLKCWDLSNLQPLETIKNIKKGNRVMENINA